MKDFITKNEGNSRFLKSVSNFLTLYPNYEDFAQALVDGTLPIDFNGYNDDGITQRGTPYSKAAVLSDATAAKLGLNSSSNPTPNDAFAALANGSRYVAINGRASSGEAIAASENGVGAIAIGPNAAATDKLGIAIGLNSNSDWSGIAIGASARSPIGAIAIGSLPNITKRGGIAIGESASVNASYGIAIGLGANAEGLTRYSEDVNEKGGNSIAIGAGARTGDGLSLAIGGNAVASKWSSVAIGASATANGNFATAIEGTVNGDWSTAIRASVNGYGLFGVGVDLRGNNSVAIASPTSSMEGDSFVAIGGSVHGNNSVAIGSRSSALNNSVVIGANASAISNDSSILIGHNVWARNQSIIIGNDISINDIWGGSVHIGLNRPHSSSFIGGPSVAVGDGCRAGGYGVAIGAGAICQQDGVVIGSNAYSIGGIAIGQNTKADAWGIAVGYQANANFARSIAIGENSTAELVDTIAFGDNAAATANGGIAIGINANATGHQAIAIGSRSSRQSGDWGNAASAGNLAVSIGVGTASYGHSVAIGFHAAVRNYDGGIAVGSNAESDGNASISVGENAIAYASNSMALGRYAHVTSFYATYSTAIGYQATASTANTIQLGDNANLSTLSCKVSLTTSSDERDKTDITPISGGATRFLRSIQAIRYVWNGRALYQEEETFTEETYTDEDGNEQTRRVSNLSEAEREKRGKFGLGTYDKEAHERGDKKGERVRVGVSAQQVQQALETVYGDSSYANLVNDNLHDFDPVEIPDDVESQLTVNYEGFVPFLIQAVKELDERVSALEK